MTKIIFDGQLVDERYYFYPQRSSEEIVNNTQPIGISDGENLVYSRTGERIISVQYHVYEEKLRNVERFLTKTFVLKRQATLIFSDEPDEVWDVVVNDKPTIVKNGAGISGVIEFLVPSGVSHSLKSTTVTPDTDGKITVGYQGTYPAYPIITATMKSENGLVAFANDKGGVLQFGSPEEVDTVTKIKSDKVIDDGMRPGQTGYTFNVGPIYYAKSVGSGVANTFDGSIKFIGETAEPQFIDDTVKHWHGPSMHRNVPANSLGNNTGSFIWRTRFNYNTDAKDLGYLEINLTSGSKVIASFAMYDGNSSIVEQKTQYFVNGKQIKSVTMNQKLFGNGFYELAVTRNQGRGNFKLSKVAKLNGESVVPGSTYQVPFVDPAFDTAAIDGVTMWLMKFANSKATSMNISDMKFHWINVPYIEDIPNRFDTGDVVTVDVANRKVYLNGVVDNTLQTVGNQWDMFKLEQGINTIKPVGSSWATQFDTQLSYKEAWL